ARSYYRPASGPNATQACLGNVTNVLGACDSRNAWRHYDDGLLTLANMFNLCLGPAGLVTKCDGNGLRVDKLWSFAGKGPDLGRLSTGPGATRILLAGQRLAGFGTTFQVGSAGDLVVRAGSAYNVVRSAAKIPPGDLPLLELTEAGLMVVSNLYGNATYTTVQPSSAGVAPYSLLIPQRGVVTLRDSRGVTLWSLRVT
ncbi:hypothetical protein HK101_006541, partial [Irineochytrium annulatum]